MLGMGFLLQFTGHHTSGRASGIYNRVSCVLSNQILLRYLEYSKTNLVAKTLSVYYIAGNLLFTQDQQVRLKALLFHVE